MSKRSDILNAAQPLFGRYGLKRVTTDDIARDAHVSKTTLYKLYKNKSDILLDVVSEELSQLSARINTAVAAEVTVENKLRAHLLTKINAIDGLINLHNITRKTLDEQWDEAQALRERFMAEESRLIAEILTEGVQSGSLAISNVKALAHFVALSLALLECPWNLAGLELTREEQVDLMVDVMLNGVRVRK